MFIVSGSKGIIKTSSDGIVWTIQKSDTFRSLYRVTWGNNLFVAIDDSGNILTTPDLKTWTNRSSAIIKKLRDVVWGKNIFVAVGDTGAIFSSPNGITWTKREPDSTPATPWGGDTITMFSHIAWGNNGFVAVGVGAYSAFYSSDGLIWKSCKLYSNNSLSSGDIYDITWAPNQFTAIGQRYSGSNSIPRTTIMTSSSGNFNTWKITEIGYSNIGAIVFGNGVYICYHYSDETKGVYSLDGLSWGLKTIDSVHNFNVGDIVFGNSIFVAISSNAIYTSPYSPVGIKGNIIAPVNYRQTLFNDANVIHYTVPSPSSVVVTILDNVGRTRHTLVNTFKQPGQYSIPLPSGLSPGAYIVSLKMGGKRIDRRVVVAK
jgi:hypothetical protein